MEPERGSARESRMMHGVLEMCVLALLEQESQHAYGLVQSLRDVGFENASYGSIYPLVTRLRKQGVLEQRLEPSESGPARNVLVINDAGRAALDVWVEQWNQTTTTAAAVLATRNERTVGARAH